ncbi:TIGR02453 family protein [Sulfurovum sp. zt1-1]|uniref:TIGR02453 family protein n=1 Tax=Sulfurovum zhangzhouensis TaxID=3019067 RepID=A0ABT7QWR7_9BACT|nr:TIGR02453 family protein [Sulfurovum zhangzhouensis]MDM5270771.1 TIGR02453 family protein [Sulfurovum zhangzhouensis]
MSESSTFLGFPKEGIKFLENIIQNNSKEWLDAHKEEYERTIVTPNKAYVEEMGEHLQILVPSIHAIPKINKSLFRIYRDARFHLDDPIKERIGIIMWQGGGHRMQSSSFYMHYDFYEVFVAAGIRNFKPPLLQTYREYIKSDANRESLHTILEDLKAKGYQIPEPEYKRLPAEFESELSFGYLTRYRSMYAYTTFKPDKTFHSEKIIDKNFKIYEDLLPLQQWVYELTLYDSKT